MPPNKARQDESKPSTRERQIAGLDEYAAKLHADAKLREFLLWEEDPEYSVRDLPVLELLSAFPPPSLSVAAAQEAGSRRDESPGLPPEGPVPGYEFSAERRYEGDNNERLHITIHGSRGDVPQELIRIPAGEFQMGSPEGVGHSDEHPQRTVTISQPFYIGVHPVTQAQYLAVMGCNPSAFADAEDSPQRPVEQVSWHAANAYCRRLAAATDLQVCLPSEAKWEYACRAGSQTKYCFADDDSELVAYAWYGQNSGMSPHGVGKLEPNAWGLYDMHGNVWEWCRDHWHGTYKGAPSDGSAWEGDDPFSPRVVRGGSWDLNPWVCRSSYRFVCLPGYRRVYVGFRVVVCVGGVD